jgi:hypothetical protein
LRINGCKLNSEVHTVGIAVSAIREATFALNKTRDIGRLENCST